MSLPWSEIPFAGGNVDGDLVRGSVSEVESVVTMFDRMGPGVEADTRVGRVTNVVRPDVPELPAGRCVRLRRLYEPRKLGSSTERFFAESFIWPIGDDGEACCVLQFSTTNIEHSRQFSKLFGAIANTFRMFEPDQPTSFD
jgi:hypothetical protein